MGRTDDRRDDRTLPVTSEVGDEGGSFSDRALQEATFEGDVPRIDRRVEPTPAPEHITSEEAESPAEGMTTYPTDRPDAPPAPRKRGTKNG